MADSNKTALEFLEELRKERAELDKLIEGLEKRLNLEPSSKVSGSDEEFPDRVSTIPMGFFHNLSQAAAAEKLLKMNPGHPMATGDILEVFKNAGMHLNPKNSVQILYTALKRSPRFERVGNKAWGLRDWYPEKKKRAGDRSLDRNSSEHNSHNDE
jgi:hypothetical protein